MNTCVRGGILAVALLFPALACGRAEEKAEGKAPAAPVAEKEPYPPAPPSRFEGWKRVEGVAARVNGVEITRDEVERRVARILQSLKARREGADVPPEEAEEVRHNVLDMLLEMEVFYQEASKHGFAAAYEEVEGALMVQKMRFAEEAHFHEALRVQGRTEAELRAELARQIVVDKYLEAFVYADKAEVKDEEALAFYGMLVEKFEKRYPGQTPPRFEAQKRFIYETINAEKKDMLRGEAANMLMEEGTVEIFDEGR